MKHISQEVSAEREQSSAQDIERKRERFSSLREVAAKYREFWHQDMVHPLSALKR